MNSLVKARVKGHRIRSRPGRFCSLRCKMWQNSRTCTKNITVIIILIRQPILFFSDNFNIEYYSAFVFMRFIGIFSPVTVPQEKGRAGAVWRMPRPPFPLVRRKGAFTCDLFCSRCHSGYGVFVLLCVSAAWRVTHTQLQHECAHTPDTLNLKLK